jgi:diacylglycerol kinase (ATP)
MGTGNDLCKTLNIPIDLKKSVRLLKKGNVSQIDVGYCNEIIFLNSLGFGFDGLTNRYACELKHLHPLLTYALSAFKAVIKHSPFELTRKIDGRVITDSAIMFSLANGRVEGGSFWIAPQASITDGKLNTILIKPVVKWLIPILLPLFLIKKPGLIPQVQTEKVEEIALKFSDRVSIHADGEVIEYTSREFFIYLCPNALKVISDC